MLIGLACGDAAARDPPNHRGREGARPPPAAYGPYGSARAIAGSDRREPGYGGYGYAPPPYAPPFPSAPPRRPPFGPMPPGAMPPGYRASRLAPLASVIESIQRRSPGHELDTGIDYVDGRQVYRILWVTRRGRRMDMIVDAETGVIRYSIKKRLDAARRRDRQRQFMLEDGNESLAATYFGGIGQERGEPFATLHRL